MCKFRQSEKLLDRLYFIAAKSNKNRPSCFEIHILNQEASLKKPLFFWPQFRKMSRARSNCALGQPGRHANKGFRCALKLLCYQSCHFGLARSLSHTSNNRFNSDYRVVSMDVLKKMPGLARHDVLTKFSLSS